MVNNGNPYTYENSSNPWLMDSKTKDDHNIVIDGNEYSAAYLWSLTTDERKKALENVFNYYRKYGFPYEEIDNETINKEFVQLQKKKHTDCFNSDGFLMNSGELGIPTTHYFCRDLFFKATTDNKSKSPEEVFNDDELFVKVLKNRMGWNTSSEGGVVRPYIFAINNKNILKGLRNSGIAREASNFRPLIAKFMYREAARLLNKETINVFDYSAGWGARAMAAASLNFNYYATDPLTSGCVTNMLQYYSNNGMTDHKYKLLNCGSEDNVIVDELGYHTIDCCGSCPPYFIMEHYSTDDNQCYNKYDEYQSWLENYWRPTVRNCNNLMKSDAVFELVMKDSYNKYDLLNDMRNIIEEEIDGIVDCKEYLYKTTKSHLTNKSKSGSVDKNNEHLLLFIRHI